MKIKKNAIKQIRQNVNVIKELHMPTTFELDFDTITMKRKTIEDVITASKQVTGDMVFEDVKDADYEE